MTSPMTTPGNGFCEPWTPEYTPLEGGPKSVGFSTLTAHHGDGHLAVTPPMYISLKPNSQQTNKIIHPEQMT